MVDFWYWPFRGDAAEELDNRHLGPEPAPHGRHLEPDITAADDGEVVRNFVERDRSKRGDDLLLIDRDARQMDCRALDITWPTSAADPLPI